MPVTLLGVQNGFTRRRLGTVRGRIRTLPSGIAPSLESVSALLLAAEEATPSVLQLAWYLLGRDPSTGPVLAELQGRATDAGIAVGTPHWYLSANELNRQADRLLSSDGRTWKRAADLLDPEGVLGIDYQGLIAIFTARIARRRGDKSRLRRIRQRLIAELRERGSSTG